MSRLTTPVASRRQHRLDPDRARRGLAEWQPLGLDILRVVIGYDHVDQPGSEPIDQGESLVLAAQRRVELQEGAIVADIDLIEREMVDRDARSDRESACRARASAVSESRFETRLT